MNWNILESEGQIGEIKSLSDSNLVLIFKHSINCNISYSMLHKLENDWNEEEMKSVKAWFLDLHAFRSVSDTVAHIFDTIHESPQMLLILNGKVVYESSHFDINYSAVKEIIEKYRLN